MQDLTKTFCALMLALGLAGIAPETAAAKSLHWDAACRCWRADSQYTTRRYVRDPLRVRTHKRIVNHTRVVKRIRVVWENRVIVHVRPIIKREVIVHRQNTIVRNITLHRVRTINKVRNEYRRETVNRYVRGWVRVVDEHRIVGAKCRCGGERRLTARN